MKASVKQKIFFLIFFLQAHSLFTEEVEVLLKKEMHVQPDNIQTIYPSISGQICFIADNAPCKEIQEGELIFKFCDMNLKIAFNDAYANLKKAALELKQEEGKKLIAEKEWEHIDPKYKTSDFGESLALRSLQIEEKKASLLLAESRFQKAKLDLERTEIYATEGIFILKVFVQKGQTVSNQDKLAEITTLDFLKLDFDLPLEAAKELFKRESIELSLSQDFSESPFKDKVRLTLNKSNFKPKGLGKNKITFSIVFENPYKLCSEHSLSYLLNLPFLVEITP
ncbi:efflux RND transporter periplasmic adaptor subunit [Criblamydia sequanensis]|uniref:Secreted protein n=1 Tax=Candidatus Criblamydia sequanensis CRIB-18 TaxID=1437425 RepID=A0A090E1N8_9BACT|nr:efflux RND transporter periplasmic adaptor subunit [Criblamydia sequanensis]CDR34654.1 putative secreted protein [Criblamydia sequanensis CRIB-18]